MVCVGLSERDLKNFGGATGGPGKIWGPGPPSSAPEDEYKQPDCITARNQTLLNFPHLSRNRYTFFLNMASRQWRIQGGQFGATTP